MSSCHLCRGRSNWQFLGEFYQNVEWSRQHATRLDFDLRNVINLWKQSKVALANCEQALRDCSTKANEDLLHFQDEINKQVEMRQEVEEMFDVVYNAAEKNSKLVDGLRGQVAELRGGPPVPGVPTTMDLVLELEFTKGQARELKSQLRESTTESQSEPTLYEDDFTQLQRYRHSEQ